MIQVESELLENILRTSFIRLPRCNKLEGFVILKSGTWYERGLFWPHWFNLVLKIIMEHLVQNMDDHLNQQTNGNI